MRKVLTRILLAAGSAAVVIALAIPPAMASGTWTVTGGRNWTGAQSSGTTITQTDVTSGTVFTCTVAAFAGTVINENSGAITTIGSITSFSFTKCTGPLGSTATKKQKAGTTATFNALSFSGGVTTGTITGWDEILTISSILGMCTAEIKGTAGVKYTNATKLLQFTTAGDSLQVTSASGSCMGIIKTGDVFTISSGTGGITITGSPTSTISISQP